MNDHSNMPEARNSVSQPDLSALNTMTTPHDQAIREAATKIVAERPHNVSRQFEHAESVLRDLVAKAVADDHKRFADSCRGELIDLRTQLTALRAENERLRQERDDCRQILETYSDAENDLAKQNLSLRARVAALEHDRERLDWLEHSGMSLCKDTGFSGGCNVWACFEAYPQAPVSTNNPFPLYDSPRAAIDAARQSGEGRGDT